ncbi:MAG: SpoIIE family protein phosphatase [Clostridia bacterium]|nr:SpoIIE family protein phosphatase [Clostridia bacterium]
MKDNVKIMAKVENYTIKELTVAVGVHFFVALSTALAGRGVILNNLIPFGLSFLGGVTPTFLPSAMLGGFVSYFIPAADVSGFRYIAALFALLSIKLLLSNYKKIVNNPIFSALISFLACFLTGLTSIGTGQAEILIVITEALLCGIASYFVNKTFDTFENEHLSLSQRDLACLLITVSLVIMGLFDFTLIGVSLGKIFGLFLILVASKYGGITAGAISGTTVGFSYLLTGNSGSLGVVFSLAGLVCGIFSSLGKYVQMAVLLIFSFIGSAVTGDITLISQTTAETFLALVMFFVMPRNVGVAFGKIFSATPRLASAQGIKKTLTMRLEMASNALRDVSETVEQVSNQLSKINAPDFGRVIYSIEQEACAGCKLRVHCWENRKNSTVDAIMEMTKAIKNGDTCPENSAPDEFKGRCLRASKVGNVTFRKYSEFASQIAAENRIDEVRGVVSDQFDGISDMLSDLSLDFKNDEYFDSVTAENTACALKSLDIRVDEAGCRIDKYGRMSLEFKLKKTKELVINKRLVMKTVSLACERDFDVPTISEVGGEIYITLSEKAVYTVDCGVEQISANDSKMCGDAYKYFNDGKGHFLMILSDGMGKGGRAAVDGAMACGLMTRLIKAGFGYDCSLKFLNSSMLFKSTDESLATVDVASIDLFTGQTELYKAGAAPTIIRRSGRTGKAESTSLPAGILRDITFDKANIRCKSGDIVVLMSDGAVNDGTDWIREEIEHWTEGSAQELAEKICKGAKRRRTDAHEDDITVLTAILTPTI